MRKAKNSLVFLIVFASAAVADEDELEPLNTRTRCILLFHDCLRDIADQDAEALVPKIADGLGAGGKTYSFRIRKSVNDLPPDLKAPDKFFKDNFPHSKLVSQSFDTIRFSPLKTSTRPAKLKFSQGKDQQGTLHTIEIRIPELDDERFTELRFVEVEGKLYWVPFGW